MNVWERVVKLTDAGQGERAVCEEKADVSRMRKLFIQLKNNPPPDSKVALKLI